MKNINDAQITLFQAVEYEIQNLTGNYEGSKAFEADPKPKPVKQIQKTRKGYEDKIAESYARIKGLMKAIEALEDKI